MPHDPGTWSASAEVAERWRARLGAARDTVRQELAASNVAAHLPASTGPLRVLDAGCGQGTQGLRLAALGHRVVGLDADAGMLAAFREALAATPPDVAARVSLLPGRVEDAIDLVGAGAFDVVLCHGVLMYVDDPEPLVAALAGVLAPGGLLSVLARNQAGIALRAGLRGRWAEAHRALQGDPAYVNELGATARADTVDGLVTLLQRHGLAVEAWYGVRVLSDGATLEAAPPTPGSDELAALLAAEDLAGRTDPYRQVAPLVQVLARAPGP